MKIRAKLDDAGCYEDGFKRQDNATQAPAFGDVCSSGALTSVYWRRAQKRFGWGELSKDLALEASVQS